MEQCTDSANYARSPNVLRSETDPRTDMNASPSSCRSGPPSVLQLLIQKAEIRRVRIRECDNVVMLEIAERRECCSDVRVGRSFSHWGNFNENTRRQGFSGVIIQPDINVISGYTLPSARQINGPCLVVIYCSVDRKIKSCVDGRGYRSGYFGSFVSCCDSYCKALAIDIENDSPGCKLSRCRLSLPLRHFLPDRLPVPYSKVLCSCRPYGMP